MMILTMVFEGRTKVIAVGWSRRCAWAISSLALVRGRRRRHRLLARVVQGRERRKPALLPRRRPGVGRHRVLVRLLAWVLLMTFLIQAFKIPSGSMEKTLLIGDHLFVNKFIYGLRVPIWGKRILSLRGRATRRRHGLRVPGHGPARLALRQDQRGRELHQARHRPARRDDHRSAPEGSSSTAS